MVCGTGSDVGKTQLVAGLCRMLRRRGVRAAPFKAQNMSLNSYVTAAGHEIARAQAVQAIAAGAAPEVAMNPVLLQATTETGARLVVLGRPAGALTAAAYHDRKPELFDTVLGTLADLRTCYDVVLLEGAGSPAEINLADRDIVNLRVAAAAGTKALVVGDIDRGGVFAALHGTLALLPADQRACVGGFVINKLRGDPRLLLDGTARLEEISGVPTLGVLAYLDNVALDAEDSLAFTGPPPRPSVATPTVLDVAAVRWPHIANATDLDPLAVEPGAGLRWVDHAAGLGRPDLIVLPATNSVIADLAWLRATGLATAIGRGDATIVGIGGGYQLLGRRIQDAHGAQAADGTTVGGLGLLAVDTTLGVHKTLAQRHGHCRGIPVAGYEAHYGRTSRLPGTQPWLTLGGEDEGAESADACRLVFGTNLHGLFECDAFRHTLLRQAADRRNVSLPAAGISFARARDEQLDRFGDLVEDHLDLAAVIRLIENAA
jgi:adenosylcobyric acid synthase